MDDWKRDDPCVRIKTPVEWYIMKSISIPFRFDNGKVVDTTDIGVIARQRIADVLATRGYERVMRPGYGAGISNLLFEPLDPLVFADYRVDALSAINENVSNATINDIRIREGNTTQLSGDSTLSVSVVYSVPGMGTATYVATVNSKNILTEESDF